MIRYWRIFINFVADKQIPTQQW